MCILPLIFSFFTFLGRYGKGNSESGAMERQLSYRYSFYATLLKTMLLEIVLLSCLSSFYIQKADSDSECWELEIGQELYRLLIFFFFGLALLPFLFEITWAFIRYG